jgi:hypothetical protein
MQVNGHVALLGDSVFDNGAYTSGGPELLAGRAPDHSQVYS